MLEAFHGCCGAAATIGPCWRFWSKFLSAANNQTKPNKINNPSLKKKKKSEISLPKILFIQIIFKFLVFFHSLHLLTFWVNISLLPVYARFITWESVAWSFFNGYKLIKVCWKTLETFPAGDEIHSVSKHFKLMKFWSTAWIAGNSDNIKIS